MPQLRAETIVRVHVTHAPTCDRACAGTFACSRCKHRVGECLRDPHLATLCMRCRRKQLASDSEQG